MVIGSQIGKNGQFCNQLFQIAVVINYALKHKMEYLLPTWKYADVFEGEFKQTNNLPVYQKYQELNFHYNEIPYIHEIDLAGYYQSELYFKEHEEEIRKLFKFKMETLTPLFVRWGDVSNKVAIHVRRKDYLDYQHYYAIPTMNYYQEAIRDFPADQKFIVFSDDIPYCRTQFIGDKFAFAEGNEVSDLALISECKRGVIMANSSYSWWGQWLGQPEKVIAPINWFNPEHPDKLDTKDLYLPHWELI